jgi:hypothetical protein
MRSFSALERLRRLAAGQYLGTATGVGNACYFLLSVVQERILRHYSKLVGQASQAETLMLLKEAVDPTGAPMFVYSCNCVFVFDFA